MRIEYGMGVEYMQIALALGLMLVNVLIFIDRGRAMSAAGRGARGFAVAAFASAIVALLALQHLLLQVWFHPSDDTAFLVFELAMIGMTLTTSAAIAFWLLSRWNA